MLGNSAGVFQRVDFNAKSDACHGVVKWSALKSIWWTTMTATWFVFFFDTLSLSSIAVFLTLTCITLCLGHSLGMHRQLIHGAFESPTWVQKLLVYLGTLVGLGGPFTMMHTHDMRDWAQRQPECHPFLSHQNSILKDFYWQLHCKLHLDNKPQYKFPQYMKDDRFYRLLQSTSMLQQLLVASILFFLGGWAWVVWGVCARVSISIFGHWLIGYFAHNSGNRDWHLTNVSVQGYNVNHLGLITFGECWHNNHHAYPGSANLGLKNNQFDPGWQILKVLETVGLVWNIKTPDNLPKPENLELLAESSLALKANKELTVENIL